MRMWCYEWKKSEALRVGRLNLDYVVNGGMNFRNPNGFYLAMYGKRVEVYF